MGKLHFLTTIIYKYQRAISIVLVVFILFSSYIALSYIFPTEKTMNVEVTDLNNNQISLSNYKGKYQIVDYMTTWCSSCSEITQILANLFKNNQIPNNVIVWTITVDPTHDSVPVMNKYIKDNNITQYVSDGQWIFARDVNLNSKKYNDLLVPYVFLLGKDLKIKDNNMGSMTQAQLLNWITQT